MHSNHPWYREPWPWLLMAGPAAVVVAGAITSVIAFTSADGLVADDYYKQGLAINRTIARSEAAKRLAIHGEIVFDGGNVRAALAADRPLGERVRLTLVHAARAGDDRIVMLSRDSTGTYTGSLPAPAAGKWTLVLETAEWRLEAPADLRAAHAVEVRAR
jgi:hypothetical protein